MYGQEVLNNVLAYQPALLADNQPVDHNRGNQPAVDAVVVLVSFLFVLFLSFIVCKPYIKGCGSTSV